MEAAVLAAGRGSRLRPLTDSEPKALLRICGVPLLGRMLESLETSSISKVFCVVRYKRKLIVDFLKKRDNRIPIEVVIPRGNSMVASCLSLVGRCKGSIVLMPCDVIFHPHELRSLLRSLQKEKFAVGVTRDISESNPLRVIVDDSGYLKAADSRLVRPSHYFAGVCCVPSKLLAELSDKESSDWKDIMQIPSLLLTRGVRVKAYEVSRCVDLDTIDQLKEAKKLLSC